MLRTAVVAAILLSTGAVAAGAGAAAPPAMFTLSAGPGTDTRQPWEYAAHGVIVGQKRPTLCAGRVLVRVLLRGRAVARRSPAVRTGIPGILAPDGAGPVCGYTTKFRLRRKPGGPRRGTFVISARFTGNAMIGPKSAPPISVRFGR